MKVGDRVFLSGANDDPRWLCGRRGYRGLITAFIPGQNAPAVVVRLDEPIELGESRGQHVVMELRYVGASWDAPEAVGHVELCDFIPESKPWPERRQGPWVETHATIETEDRAIARGAV